MGNIGVHMDPCTRLSAQIPLKATTAFKFSDFNEIFIKFCVKNIRDSIPKRYLGKFPFGNFLFTFLLAWGMFVPLSTERRLTIEWREQSIERAYKYSFYAKVPRAYDDPKTALMVTQKRRLGAMNPMWPICEYKVWPRRASSNYSKNYVTLI